MTMMMWGLHLLLTILTTLGGRLKKAPSLCLLLPFLRATTT
jgi:hypothetical protein